MENVSDTNELPLAVYLLPAWALLDLHLRNRNTCSLDVVKLEEKENLC